MSNHIIVYLLFLVADFSKSTMLVLAFFLTKTATKTNSNFKESAAVCVGTKPYLTANILLRVTIGLPAIRLHKKWVNGKSASHCGHMGDANLGFL